MHVLVTGARGFVGRRLVPRLEAAGHRVTPHDLDVDIADPLAVDQALAAARPEAVIHLAALTSVADSFADPVGSFRVNYLGTRTVLESAQRHCKNARVLIISSGELYGRGEPGLRPRRESDPLAPNSPYAHNKAAAEKFAAALAQEGADIVRIRAFNHTGAGQADHFVASSFARQISEIERGSQPPLLRVGNLESVRDFLDVEDVIRAYLLLLDPNVPADLYNVASGRPVAIREILENLLGQSSADPKIEVDSARLRPTDTLVGDPRKLREATGWDAQIPLAQTLADLLTFWRQHPARSGPSE